MAKKQKVLTSEAAIKYVIKNWCKIFTVADDLDPVINFYLPGRGASKFVATLDLRDFVKKRQPLTGIKKEFAKIVRGKRRKK